MKAIRPPSRLLSLALIYLSSTHLFGQIFKTLHSFNGSDGSHPLGSVALSSNTLFVTPRYGGSANRGTVLALKTDGSSPTNLHSFTGADGSGPNYDPLVSGNSLYGTTLEGGGGGLGMGSGTVFKINTDGSGFTNLHVFTQVLGSGPYITNNDGAFPSGGLALSDETLFGVTGNGGKFANGALFSIGINGTGFTNLHSFSPDEGRGPNCVIVSGNMLYGTTHFGTNEMGNIFAISKDGSSFRELHSFSGAEGAYPTGGLTLSSNVLFGTTHNAGPTSSAGIYRINTDGSGFRVLHSFNGPNEGGSPQCALALWGNTLYGTTSDTIFALDVNGTSFATLYTFSGSTNGGSPFGRLLKSGNRLYGTTFVGGTADFGTIFSFEIVTPLSIANYATNLLLAWPTHPSGFTLQSTTNLLNPVWHDVTSEPAILNGQNIVIEPSTGTPHFYRLSQ